MGNLYECTTNFDGKRTTNIEQRLDKWHLINITINTIYKKPMKKLTNFQVIQIAKNTKSFGFPNLNKKTKNNFSANQNQKLTFDIR